MSEIISQEKDLICIILENLIDKLNHNFKQNKRNIPLIDVLNDDKKQYENVIIKFINYHINRFNQTNDLQIRLHVINIFYRMLY